MKILNLLFPLLLILLQGCTAIQTFPTVARAGDTVTLAIGSAERMTKSNTTIKYTPDLDPGNPVTIPPDNIRSIIPIYPDKRTTAWSYSAATSIDGAAGHGAWLTVIVLDLPSALLPGTGKINIQTTASFPEFAPHINDVDTSLEILPGIGVPNDFKYQFIVDQVGDLSNLEVLNHYLIKPDYVNGSLFSSPWPQYSAIEITVVGDLLADDNILDQNMRVIMDEMEDNIKSQMNMTWKRNGNTTVINIISPQGTLNYYNARASIFFLNNDYIYIPTPEISARYFDIDGNEIAGPVVNIEYVSN